MSKRSIYLRDQADKCRWHASRITSADTKEQLLVLAAEYIMRAVEIESEERGAPQERHPHSIHSPATTQRGPVVRLGFKPQLRFL